ASLVDGEGSPIRPRLEPSEIQGKTVVPAHGTSIEVRVDRPAGDLARIVDVAGLAVAGSQLRQRMRDPVRPQQRNVDVHARSQLQKTDGDPVVVERLDRGGRAEVHDRVAEPTFDAKRRI